MNPELRLELKLRPPPVILLDEIRHEYTVDGVPKRSLSHILRPLMDDMSSIPAHILENAKARGSQVDDACSLIMEGKFTNPHDEMLAEEARPYVDAYREFWKLHDFHRAMNPVSVQTPLYCAKLDFCCTPDWHDDLSVNDIKATAKVSRAWGLQTAGQQLAHGIAMVRRIIHLTPKLKTRQYRVYTDGDGDPRIFSPLDYQVVEAACLGDYEADCIKRWRAGE